MKACRIAITFLGFCVNANAYDPVTHETASESAAKASVLADTAYLARIGLKSESIRSDIYNVFYSSEATQLSIVELIKFGANWEDTRRSAQGKNHFFNPLTGNGKALPPPFDDGPPSPNWALEDKTQYADQPFSYRKGRRCFLNALTMSNKGDRNNNWGLTFQTLGHVIHHLQDMAQPQHTRDDAHCDIFPCNPTGLFGFSKTNIEEWTKKNAPSEFFEGYAPVYSKDESLAFTLPRKFWTTSLSIVGKGIAEYSNRGFFSAGTNVGSGFPFPIIDPNAGKKIDIQEACDTAITPTPCPRGLRGNITFFATNVNDSFRPDQSGINPRATTRSVFDADLKRRSILPKYSVNRFTFDTANSFLLKRAVGYSAGMINYFFRGDIDLVEDPAQPGTYAIQNKGTEPMTGTFGLYYDDASELRSLHKSWELTIAPGGQVNVGAIDLPSNPPPKNPDEFMLVFNGDMGEETRAMFGTGAVTGAIVSLYAGNALYLTGQDASNQLVHLRVDRMGTHVIEGNDFHPLRDFITDNAAVYAKSYLAKQAEFFKNNEAYRTRALVVGKPRTPVINAYSYVFHRDVAKPRRSVDYQSFFNELNWQAMAELPVGPRQFQFRFTPNGATAGKLTYTRFQFVDGRAYQDAAGNVALPAMPSGYVYLSYEDANRGKLVISPNGRTILGFKSGATGGHRVHFELRLTIGTNVSAAWIESLREKPVSATDDSSQAVTSLDTLTIRVQLPPCAKPSEFQVRINRYQSSLASRYATSETSFFDQQRGSLLGIRYDDEYTHIKAYDKVYGANGTGDYCSSLVWQYRKFSGWTVDYAETRRKYVLPEGELSSFWRERYDDSREVGPPSPRGPMSNVSIDYSYEGYEAQESRILPYEPFGPDAIPRLDRVVVRPLTAQLADAVTAERSATWFRGKAISHPVTRELSYVADASPLGEVFFANNYDLANLIHEPRAGGMQKVVLPPNVVKLLGAVWM